MPKIPQYQPDVGQSFGEAQPRETGAVGQIIGNSMQSFGQELGTFGRSVTQYEQVESARKEAKQANTRAIYANSARQQVETIRDTVENDTYLNSDEAGENMDRNYSESFKKQTAGLTKNISDPILKTQIETQINDTYNEGRRRILQASRAQYEKFSLTQYEAQLNNSSGKLLRNPTDFQKEFTAYSSMIDQSALTDPNKEKAKRLAGEQMARSTVIGLAEMGEYEAAKKSISGPLAQFLKPADQEKLTEEIASRRLKATDIALKENDREIKKLVEQKKNINDKYLRDRVGTMSELVTSGNVANTDLKQWEQLINEDIEMGDLTPSQGDWLKSTMNKAVLRNEKATSEELKTTHANNLKDLSVQIGTADNLDALRNKIIEAELDPKDAINAINRLDAEKNRRQARARAGKSSKDPILADRLKRLEKLYPATVFGVSKRSNIIEGGQAFDDMMNNYNNNPKTRGNAAKSFDLTLRRFKGGEGVSEKIPFLPSKFQDISTPEKENAAKAQLLEMKSTGKINSIELNESLKMLLKKKAAPVAPPKKEVK